MTGTWPGLSGGRVGRSKGLRIINNCASDVEPGIPIGYQ
jgi:hypothetical protein